MSVKTAYRAFFLPEWGGSVLKKRAAAWFTMRSKGLGDASPTSGIVIYGITMPRLRLAKGHYPNHIQGRVICRKVFHEQIWIAGCRFSHKMV